MVGGIDVVHVSVVDGIGVVRVRVVSIVGVIQYSSSWADTFGHDGRSWW